MSDWYSDYKRFHGNHENIGFMTGSQAARLVALSNEIDGYATTADLQVEVERASLAELELNIALDIFDGYRVVSSELYPSTMTWWSSGTPVKMKEVVYIRNANNQPTTITTNLYNNGVVYKTITDTITYNGIIEASRNRSLS